MTVAVCRGCGETFTLKSRFEAECPECGSEELDAEDAYDPIEHELRCEFCGYVIDTAAAEDPEWAEPGAPSEPESVDDPCPICDGALVPVATRSPLRALPEYKVARAAAQKLHREHAIAGPPYALEALAEELGLTVVTGSFEHDGLLVGERIELPQSATPQARRFALAHEIGHHLLRHQGERSKVEPEANAFASELLIPRDELNTAVEADPSARALARRFGVSRQAMVYALMSAHKIDRVRR
jgi:Zn finger protein HypA/HybF involved in hydrogenase expression